MQDERPPAKRGRFSASENKDLLDCFSDDLLGVIFKYLTSIQLWSSFCVCHRWRDVITRMMFEADISATPDNILDILCDSINIRPRPAAVLLRPGRYDLDFDLTNSLRLIGLGEPSYVQIKGHIVCRRGCQARLENLTLTEPDVLTSNSSLLVESGARACLEKVQIFSGDTSRNSSNASGEEAAKHMAVHVSGPSAHLTMIGCSVSSREHRNFALSVDSSGIAKVRQCVIRDFLCAVVVIGEHAKATLHDCRLYASGFGELLNVCDQAEVSVRNSILRQSGPGCVNPSISVSLSSAVFFDNDMEMVDGILANESNFLFSRNKMRTSKVGDWSHALQIEGGSGKTLVAINDNVIRSAGSTGMYVNIPERCVFHASGNDIAQLVPSAGPAEAIEELVAFTEEPLSFIPIEFVDEFV